MKVKGLAVVRKRRIKREEKKIKTTIVRSTHRNRKNLILKANAHRERDNRLKYQNAKSFALIVINGYLRKVANMSYSTFIKLYSDFCKEKKITRLNSFILMHLIKNAQDSFKKFILDPLKKV